MCAKWNKDFKCPDSLASEFDRLKIRDDKHTSVITTSLVGFEEVKFIGSADFEYAIAQLQSAIELSGLITPLEKASLVRQALFASAKSGSITKQSLIKEISKQENKLLKLPEFTYFIITTISIKYSQDIKKISSGFKSLSLSDKLPRNFLIHREKMVENLEKDYLPIKAPKNYTFVRCAIKAKTPHQAYTQGMNVIDLFRFACNYYFNWNIGYSRSFGRNDSVNKITLGPIHTVHLSAGELAWENCWYDPSFIRLKTPKIIKETEVSDIKILIKKINSYLKNIEPAYQVEIREGLLRYVRALDESESSVSFLKLWSVLEYLTSTEKADYKTTINRASYLYKKEHANSNKNILYYIKSCRNEMVHADILHNDISTNIYVLKPFVEALLDFYLSYSKKFKFRSLKEAAAFLDHPLDSIELKNSIERLKFNMKNLTRAHKHRLKIESI